MPILPEVLISVDIESTGPIPGDYSMYQLGACLVENPEVNFGADLALLNDNYVPSALESCGVTIEELKAKGEEPRIVMARLKDWITTSVDGGRPVFAAHNGVYDWSFVNWYFHHFLKENPFGISGLEIKSYYAGMMGCDWISTTKRRMDKRFRVSAKHTHRALDDAIEQAMIFKKMIDFNRERVGTGC